MRLTAAQRRDLRSAKKKLKWEKARERYISRSHLTKYLVCYALVGIGLIFVAVCVATLINMHAEYEYETGISVLKLPAVTGTGYLRIDIEYAGECPDEFILKNGDEEIPMGDLEVMIDSSRKLLTIGYDTERVSADYSLSIRPKDNLELRYRAVVEESYRYMVCQADNYKDQDGHLWISLAASYGRGPQGIKCRIEGRGERYMPVIFEYFIPQKLMFPLDITALAEAQGIRLGDCYEVSVELSVSESPIAEPRKYIFDTASWPEYDQDTPGNKYDGANTETYVENAL